MLNKVFSMANINKVLDTEHLHNNITTYVYLFRVAVEFYFIVGTSLSSSAGRHPLLDEANIRRKFI